MHTRFTHTPIHMQSNHICTHTHTHAGTKPERPVRTVHSTCVCVCACVCVYSVAGMTGNPALDALLEDLVVSRDQVCVATGKIIRDTGYFNCK